MQLDIADEDAPEKIVHKAVESFGKVDILVNAAGITRRYLALEISEQDWNDVIQTNLTALFFLSQKWPDNSFDKVREETSSILHRCFLIKEDFV